MLRKEEPPPAVVFPAHRPRHLDQFERLRRAAHLFLAFNLYIHDNAREKNRQEGHHRVE